MHALEELGKFYSRVRDVIGPRSQQRASAIDEYGAKGVKRSIWVSWDTTRVSRDITTLGWDIAGLVSVCDCW